MHFLALLQESQPQTIAAAWLGTSLIIASVILVVGAVICTLILARRQNK